MSEKLKSISAGRNVELSWAWIYSQTFALHKGIHTKFNFKI